MTLFTTAYFPSISYMARFLTEDEPFVEIWETYHKQTYRNRCRVMTANGVESLSVPVVKVNGNHTMTKDMTISTIEPWQHIHSRCLESAYKAAPYFDHYYDYLRPIFEGHFERLIDLNDAALQAVLKMLKVKKEIVTLQITSARRRTTYAKLSAPKRLLKTTHSQSITKFSAPSSLLHLI